MNGKAHKILSVVVVLVLVISIYAVIVGPASASISAISFVATPNIAGALASYTITFTTGAALTAGIDTITVIFPAGTTVPPSIAKADIQVQVAPRPFADAAASEPDPLVSGLAVTLLIPRAAGNAVATNVITVRFSQHAGIKNPTLITTAMGTVYTSAETENSTTYLAFIPSVTFTPAQSPIGGAVTVTGVGFAPNSSIDLTGGVTGSGTTDATGAFTIIGTAVAAAVITATDGAGNSAVATIGNLTLITPIISLSPNTGPVGTVVAITGANFHVVATINATFTTPGTLIATRVGTGTTDSAGNASITFTIPTSEAGLATVALTDAMGGTKAVIFTVTQGAIVVTVQNALSSVSTQVLVVWTFNAKTQTWQVYDSTAPAVSDLTTMTIGQGYWMQASANCTLTFGVKSYNLVKGWNFIGWLG